MRKWDKVKNKYNDTEGMIVGINEELDTVDVRCEEQTKTLTMAQFERYWETTYAIKKSGPKPKPKKPGPKPKPKKRGPKPKPKVGGSKKVHRSKYETGTIARYWDIHSLSHKKKYRKKVPVNEILEYIKDIAINQYGMAFEQINDRDYKFRTPYTGESNKDGYSKQCTLMVRLYNSQANMYTKSMWLTDEINRNSRMLFQKYYYDKMMRIPNFNDDTKEFIKKVIDSVNVNYKPVERPKTYKRTQGKRKNKPTLHERRKDKCE